MSVDSAGTSPVRWTADRARPAPVVVGLRSRRFAVTAAWAADLALERGTEVVGVHVVGPVPHTDPTWPELLPSVDFAAEEAALDDLIGSVFRAARLAYRIEVVQGAVLPSLLGVVARERASVLVVGRGMRRRRGIAGLAIRSASCAVAVVPPASASAEHLLPMRW